MKSLVLALALVAPLQSKAAEARVAGLVTALGDASDTDPAPEAVHDIVTSRG